MNRRRLLLSLCILLAGLVFANSLGNGFALDDTPIIQENERLHDLHNLPQTVTSPYWPGVPSRYGLYRPVTLTSYMLEWQLWDGQPWGFHLINVLLHMAVTGLLFLMLIRLGASSIAAAAGAALFAVHPVHVEAVANIVGRAELAATAFYLAACLVYLRAGPGWRGAVGVGVLYGLGAGSKEIGVTLPGALVLLELARARQSGGGLWGATWEGIRSRWRSYLAVIVVGCGYFLARNASIGTFFGGESPPGLWGEPASTRVFTAIRVIPEYLRLMVFPMDLVADYGAAVIVPESSLWAPLVLSGVVAAVLMLVLAWISWRRAPLVTVGILWFAGTVFPVTNLVFTTGIILAERTLYLPSVGLGIAVAGVAGALRVHRRLLRPAALVFVVVLIGFGARTWVQNPVWSSTRHVLEYLIRTHPESYRAQWVLAESFRPTDPEAARDHLRLALRMAPGYYNLRMSFAQDLYDGGEFDEAAAHFDTATALIPEHEKPYIYRIASLIEAGRAAEAAEVAEAVIERFPSSEAAFHQRSRALARADRYEDARRSRTRAIELSDSIQRWPQWIHLAALELLLGDTASAHAALRRARATAPDSAAVPALLQLAERVAAPDRRQVPLW